MFGCSLTNIHLHLQHKQLLQLHTYKDFGEKSVENYYGFYTKFHCFSTLLSIEITKLSLLTPHRMCWFWQKKKQKIQMGETCHKMITMDGSRLEAKKLLTLQSFGRLLMIFWVFDQWALPILLLLIAIVSNSKFMQAVECQTIHEFCFISSILPETYQFSLVKSKRYATQNRN